MMQLWPVFADFLLTDIEQFEGQTYTLDESNQHMHLTVCSVQSESVCPICQHCSSRA